MMFSPWLMMLIASHSPLIAMGYKLKSGLYSFWIDCEHVTKVIERVTAAPKCFFLQAWGEFG
jgi:hypothetical protein